jgi:hypothetical protein
MINTVPSGVTLRDPVVPIPFKPRDYLLSVTAAGTLNLQVTADVRLEIQTIRRVPICNLPIYRSLDPL